ncbi:FAD-binding oxidoreductase [Citreicella sp. C3M06]|uniref:NAD(P)/FAD-dependent oxidoreductase n=1 Tax=Citreicella sp. C3M06 TaxID=2841564 RepID=UPI001C0875E9|nr:FAD-binding oxidoreductase [Citreicella sp. C3M06]MBU2963153.1 FAD-binding oxidoreductase [Citreicella sp. C3M06]
MTSIDVTVRGAGIFGLSIAWACVQAGARVQVIDPFGPGAGSSGGLVGALAPHVPENWNAKKQIQLDSLLMAQDFWADVEATGGVFADYARSGRLQPIADERALALAHARAESARQLWQHHATWEVIRAEAAGPWAPVTPSGWLIRDTLSARMSPRRAAAALVAALAVRGVQVSRDAPEQGRVLHATGWQGLRKLSETLGKPVGSGVKGQSLLLRHASGEVPQIFANGLHIVPHHDGTVAIGSTSERDFTDPSECDAQCDDLHQRALAALPLLHGAEIVERWAGVRPRAKSRAPMLGHWPDRPGHYIANGGFKIGFGMAPKVAQIMTELLLNDKDIIPDGFRVTDSL